ncbi:MAG: hypothetical protein ACLPKB_02215 [Xanthobacteraceae bacterium]
MERFIHRKNLARYRKMLAESTDETQRRMLQRLIAEEAAKDQKPLSGG